jgi:hypothetical protein
MTQPPGWLTAAEADELRRLASDRTVLELGAWKGRSTVVLAEVARYVVSVDRHEGIPEVGGEDSLPDYLANVRGLANVGIVIAEFNLFVPWLLRAFDVVYVDGDHDRDSAARDAALARASALETIAFHDWDFESVRDGATSVLGREPDGLVGSVASYRVGA